MSANASPERLQGFAALAERYDGFILDQWGVLHDGTNPYAGAADCLQRLRRTGARIVVLSNSGKRASENARRMTAAGFPPDLYDRLISAGEDAHDGLLHRRTAFHRALGRRCFALRRADDADLLAGLELDLVDRMADAEFVLLIGVPESRNLVERYGGLLESALGHGLPMVCANPDVTRVTVNGLGEAPGTLAEHYQMLGGTVHFHGKPHPPIYESCFAELGNIPRDRILAVGDSIDHDILGASRVGIASAFVAGGIHADALGVAWGELPPPERWHTFAATAAALPTHLLPAFTW